ncbi:MAG: D-alanyl-D-alanine dipeptidase [Rhodospirillales bacterium]|nr:D-alanyl-D-alanine dipeptidase [Rhodospirillales bacterium]
MSLISITPDSHDVELEIVYATSSNFTGAPVYGRAACYLHEEAEALLRRAVAIAQHMGFRLKIFDAFRPVEAQWALWEHTPDPEFLADPRRGSPHSRGAAVDLTLIDDHGQELEMGTAFDEFSPLSHHGNLDINGQAQRNRALLIGLMSAAGWDFYRNEWWHYQLFDAKRLPVLNDHDLDEPMMPETSI